MNVIFLLIAFLALVGLLASRMVQEQRRAEAYGEMLGQPVPQQTHSPDSKR